MHDQMTRAEMEERRVAAIPLFTAGKTAGAVARELGVSRQSGLRWRNAWRAGTSIASRRATGRPRSVDRDAIAELVAGGGIRTAKQLRLAIALVFGRTYQLDHCCKLLVDARQRLAAVARLAA